MLRAIFRLLRLSGDAQAIARGTFGRRLANRYAHRMLARLLRGL